jgi:hypothetical protein
MESREACPSQLSLRKGDSALPDRLLFAFEVRIVEIVRFRQAGPRRGRVWSTKVEGGIQQRAKWKSILLNIMMLEDVLTQLAC